MATHIEAVPEFPFGLAQKHLQFAFQPIVGIRSGRCVAVEALTRGVDRIGFATVPEMLETAAGSGRLRLLENLLRQGALTAFRQLDKADELTLFLNVDNRVLEDSADRPENWLDAMRERGVSPLSVVIEVSERREIRDLEALQRRLARYRDAGVQIALDDFGTGYSGLSLLYDLHPDFIKLDRYFIANIDADPRKRVFAAHAVELAKTLGIQVIAEGVETAAEFRTCEQIGCDRVQGYWTGAPALDARRVRCHCERVTELHAGERRRPRDDADCAEEQVDPAPTVHADMRMADVFEMFRRNPDRRAFPFVGVEGEPRGLVRERDLKAYIYSACGRDLLSRKRLGDCFGQFVYPALRAEVGTPIEALLEAYTAGGGGEGVLLTRDGRYHGMLHAEALLLVMHKRSLEQARDQNPLTQLPGNRMIQRFIGERLHVSEPTTMAYVDLNHFKAYNDHYGFRQGDRVLRLLAELLGKRLSEHNAFVGHIGGDDFFVGLPGDDGRLLPRTLGGILDSFREDVRAFYEEAHRRAGCLRGIDRRGRVRRFPLLTACAATAVLAPQSRQRDDAALMQLLADLKQQAKADGADVTLACLP